MATHILLVLIKEPKDVLKQHNNLSGLNHLSSLSAWISRQSRNAKFTLRTRAEIKKKWVNQPSISGEEKCVIGFLGQTTDYNPDSRRHNVRLGWFERNIRLSWVVFLEFWTNCRTTLFIASWLHKPWRGKCLNNNHKLWQFRVIMMLCLLE